MLYIEIELDDITLWSRIDYLYLSCQQMKNVFDHMDEEEELEM